MTDIFLKTPRGSFSLLDGFSICERRHFYDRSGPKQPPTKPMLRGLHAHDTMEELAKRFLQFTNWDIAFAGAELKDGPVPAKKLTDWVEGVRPILEATRPVAVEEWFGCAQNEWNMCGKIDLRSATTPCLDDMGRATGRSLDKPCVLDYKSISSARYCKSEFEARKSLQLALYGLVKKVSMAGFVYLLPSGDVRATIVELDPAFLEKASRWVHETYERIQRCWYEARGLESEGEPPEKAFSLAPVDHPFCSVKCQHWAKCLGKE